MRIQRFTPIFLIAFCLAAPAVAEDASMAGIAVYPAEIDLSFQQDRQRFIVVATRSDGVTQDVTRSATVTLADPNVVRQEGNVLYPAADGETTISVSHEGQSAQAKIVVRNAATPKEVSFHLDVMPVFMRSGCNTGSCHGAARGKDGFRLSLFGFDPQGDHYRLTREISFRRINLAVPEASLLMEKSVGTVPHTGGKRFEVNSEYYNVMKEWLEKGAPLDQGEIPTVTRLEVFPPKAVLEGADTTQQFIARAVYSDGNDRDVTHLAVFQTNNDNSAPVNEGGLVTAAARGEAFVMARFDTHTVGSQVLVLPKDLQYTAPPITGNYIDELVGAKLMKLRLLPSELCSDEEFLRRTAIDIAGQLPTAEEYAAFMADADPAKRAKWVDELLSRKEFSEIWAMKWAELLMVKSSNQVSYKSTFLYNSWLTEQIANDVPLDQMVRELLSASGGTFSEPATNYYQIERDTLKTAENVAQVFMGIRTQCAQCHNHPFDRWTMDDYYSFAGFFSQIGRKQGEDYRETIVFNQNSGEVRHLLGNKVMPPKFLGGEQPEIKGGEDRRAVMAQWLTSPENPYFAPSVANRIWAHFLGKGIVEPVDDFRVSNPASNPELLAALGARLIEYKYDFKKLVRDICNSHTYQRSFARNESNQADENNFAHAIVRRISAETLLDCTSQVTNTKDKFRGLPLGARATQIADGQTSNYFLDTFGRSDRATVCSCEASTAPTLSQALHMINGSAVHAKVRSGGLVNQWIEAGLANDAIITEIYIRSLSRKPTDEELKQLLQTVAEAGNQQTGLEDVFWAVLNSREYLFNH